MEWKDFITRYKRDHLTKALSELESFRAERSLADAIKRAAHAMDTHGVRYGHIRSTPQEAFNAACTKLAEAELTLSHCNDFAELLEKIEHLLHGVWGLGEVFYYDTALRIGARIRSGLTPDSVYLHGGTRDGAIASDEFERKKNRRCIPRSELPEQLRALPCWQVEDILCLFRKEFPGFPAATSKSRRGRCGSQERRGCP